MTDPNYVPFIGTKIHYGSLLKMQQIFLSKSGWLWTEVCAEPYLPDNAHPLPQSCLAHHGEPACDAVLGAICTDS